jgi:NAD-dependent dihydropyrimidine dehydrogenase PreA subunit
MKKGKKRSAIQRRDFLKASAAAGAAITFKGSGDILKGAADEKEKVYIVPNIATPNRPVIRNPEICNGCNTCVNVCQIDVYIPNPERGKPPITLHPDECWYCGCCVNECPRLSLGAIKFNWPLQQRITQGCDSRTHQASESRAPGEQNNEWDSGRRLKR